MNINRNNYENYFLLYIDNELCQADKKAVDEFLQQHTDLQQELLMLQQTVLNPEDISFGLKKNLLKPEPAYQEKLLLLLDGELSAVDAAALNSEIQASQNLRQEWELLQQTKLQPQEEVIFEHKEMLLRREPARVIPVFGLRAAAAVFIGLSLVGTVLMFNNKNSKQPGGDTAKETTVINGGINENMPSVNLVVKQADVVAGTDAVVQQPAFEKEAKAGAVTNEKQANIVEGRQDLSAAAKEKNQPQKENIAIVERLQNINKDNSNETGNSTVQLKERIAQPAVTETIKSNSVKDPVDPVMESSLKANNALYAVDTKRDETQQSDYLTPDDKKFRRSGLIRKVSRFLQRSTKKKADGDGLKIAGFEFAVR